MLVAPPHDAKELARGLAGVEGKTFDLLATDERDRYYELAAWVSEEYLTGDDFHEGCMAENTFYDGLREAFEDGYQRRELEALAALAELGRTSGEAAKATLRTAYAAVRGTESRQAMDAKISAYMQERKRAE